MLTLAPTTGAPPVPVTWPLMVVPCAWANAGDSPSTAPATARKRETLPVIPIQHLSDSGTRMRLVVLRTWSADHNRRAADISASGNEQEYPLIRLTLDADGDAAGHRKPRSRKPGTGNPGVTSIALQLRCRVMPMSTLGNSRTNGAGSDSIAHDAAASVSTPSDGGRFLGHHSDVVV